MFTFQIMLKETYQRPSTDTPWFFFDIDHLDKPWKILGFDEEPSWWQQHYGSAPYGSDNDCWKDIKTGNIRDGDQQGINTTEHPFITEMIKEYEIYQDFRNNGKIISYKETGFDTEIYTTEIIFKDSFSYEEFSNLLKNGKEDFINAIDQHFMDNMITLEIEEFLIDSE